MVFPGNYRMVFGGTIGWYSEDVPANPSWGRDQGRQMIRRGELGVGDRVLVERGLIYYYHPTRQISKNSRTKVFLLQQNRCVKRKISSKVLQRLGIMIIEQVKPQSFQELIRQKIGGVGGCFCNWMRMSQICSNSQKSSNIVLSCLLNIYFQAAAESL